jgi:hypothetical protein
MIIYIFGTLLAIYICEEKTINIALVKANAMATYLLNKGEKKCKRKYL